jgi:hypothetical protein
VRGVAKWVAKKWTPSPSIYTPRYRRESTPNTAGIHCKTNKEAPRGRPGSTDPRSVQPILGLDRPPVGPLVLCFLVVAIRWVLMAVPGVHGVLRWFGSWALQSMWRPHVVLWFVGGVPLLDWWHDLHAWNPWWQPLHGWGDVVWTIKGEFVTSFMLIFLQSNNLQGQVELHYSY